MDTLRLDIWLDISCLFRTRSEAQKACRMGRIDVNGQAAKPHREVRPGDEIVIKRPLGRKQTVMVHGASGGVGTLLVQLARLAGADVIGTASVAKHAGVRALGAVPVDYKSENVLQRVREISPRGIDAVFDQVLTGRAIRLDVARR